MLCKISYLGYKISYILYKISYILNKISNIKYDILFNSTYILYTK